MSPEPYSILFTIVFLVFAIGWTAAVVNFWDTHQISAWKGFFLVSLPYIFFYWYVVFEFKMGLLGL